MIEVGESYSSQFGEKFEVLSKQVIRLDINESFVYSAILRTYDISEIIIQGSTQYRHISGNCKGEKFMFPSMSHDFANKFFNQISEMM